MTEALLGSLIDKVDAQDRRIEDLTEKLDKILAFEEILSPFKTELEGLRTELKKIFFTEQAMSELSGRLTTTIELFKKPVEQKIIHQHDVPKTIWATAALFLSLCLTLTGWFTTYNKLQLYKANDTKYRYMKLKPSEGLSKWLNMVDSLYQTDPKMREFVIEKEEQKQRDFEIIQKVLEMENGTINLKKKASKKGR